MKKPHRRSAKKSNYYTLVPTHEIETINALAEVLLESSERTIKALTKADESLAKTLKYLADNKKSRGDNNGCSEYINTNDKK